MAYEAVHDLFELGRIFLFRITSWIKSSINTGVVALGQTRDNLVLAFIITSAVAAIDAFLLTRLDPIREFGWYERVDFLEAFPRSSASGDFLAVVFAAMAVIVALLFSISLVAHQIATQRFGETVSTLLFHEPITAFIRSVLTVGTILILTTLFVQKADVFVPFLGVYASFGVVVISLLLLSTYVTQNAALARVGGVATQLTNEAIHEIRVVSSEGRFGRSVEAHSLSVIRTSLADSALLIEQLQLRLKDERGTATALATLPTVLRFYIGRKHQIDSESEWFPVHEVTEQSSYGHSVLREIYGRQALGPPRQQERHHAWLEDSITRTLNMVHSRAFEKDQSVVFEAAVDAYAGVSEAAVEEWRFELLDEILGTWTYFCEHCKDDEMVSCMMRGVGTIAELLTRMDDPKEALEPVASALAIGELSPPARPNSLRTIVEEYRLRLKKEIAHEGHVVTPPAFILADLEKEWDSLIGNEVGRLLQACFVALTRLTDRLLGKTSVRAQEAALALLVIQRRAVIFEKIEPDDLDPKAAALALQAYQLNNEDPFQGRELLSELVHWIALATHREVEPLSERLLEPLLAVIVGEVDRGGDRRINAMRTLLAVGGLLKLSAEFRQDNTLVDSFVGKVINAGFSREGMEALADSYQRMFSRILGGDIMMEFQWLANEFHAKLDALVPAGSAQLTLNPQLNHPSALLRSWAPGLNIEDLAQAFIEQLITRYADSEGGASPDSPRE